jgi:hypothetical protein
MPDTCTLARNCATSSVAADAPPLAHRLGEDLQRVTPRGDGAIDGTRQSARNGQMGT